MLLIALQIVPEHPLRREASLHSSSTSLCQTLPSRLVPREIDERFRDA